MSYIYHILVIALSYIILRCFACVCINVLYITGPWQAYLLNIHGIWYVFDWNTSMNGIYCWQDCLATIPPYLYYIGKRHGGAHYDAAASISDPDSMWIVRPHPFFTCTVRPPPRNQRSPQQVCRRHSSQPGLLQCLWGSSPANNWNYGVKWN